MDRRKLVPTKPPDWLSELQKLKGTLRQSTQETERYPRGPVSNWALPHKAAARTLRDKLPSLWANEVKRSFLPLPASSRQTRLKPCWPQPYHSFGIPQNHLLHESPHPVLASHPFYRQQTKAQVIHNQQQKRNQKSPPPPPLSVSLFTAREEEDLEDEDLPLLATAKGNGTGLFTQNDQTSLSQGYTAQE